MTDTPDIASIPVIYAHEAAGLGDVPADLSDTAIILNAPRPLLGKATWQGPFRHGIFYAAVEPTDQQLIASNLRDDAERIVVVTNDDVRTLVDQRLAESGYTREDAEGLSDAELAATYQLPWHEPEAT